jgi:TolB-like protein/Flp pilus assembly protein TadD
MLYRFNGFELDDACHELRLQGVPVPLQPRVLSRLFSVVGRADRAISKRQLLDDVWEGAIVVEAALTRAVSVLRSTLGDTDRERRLIVTVPGIGYRFAAPVETVDEPTPAPPASSPVPPSPATAWREVLDRPALAILPFTQPGASDDDYFADGVTEELTTALSCWKRFPVICRRSAFAYRGSELGLREIAGALEARYILEGNIRRSGDRIRISAELSDAEQGHQLWSERYERPLDDLFELQDEICEQIVRGIEPELARAEIDRALRKAPESLDAWDLGLQAAAKLYGGNPESLVEAGLLLERALELDPTCPHVHSLLALHHFEEALLGWSADPPTALAKALEAAQRACRLDPRDWLAHALLGIATLWVHGDHDRAIALEERALELNPSGARSYQFMGCVLQFAGRIAEAAEALQTALRLDPQLQSQALVLSDLALCHLLLDEPHEAVRLCDQALDHEPANARALQRRLAALGHLGEAALAAENLDRLLAAQPSFGVEYLRATYPFRRTQDRSHFLDGLERAGFHAAAQV